MKYITNTGLLALSLVSLLAASGCSTNPVAGTPQQIDAYSESELRSGGELTALCPEQSPRYVYDLLVEKLSACYPDKSQGLLRTSYSEIRHSEVAPGHYAIIRSTWSRGGRAKITDVVYIDPGDAACGTLVSAYTQHLLDETKAGGSRDYITRYQTWLAGKPVQCPS